MGEKKDDKKIISSIFGSYNALIGSDFCGGLPKSFYNCFEFANRNEKTYAKIEMENDAVTILDVPGGVGGKTTVKLEYGTDPNKETKINFAVNGSENIVSLAPSTAWFEMKTVTFNVELKKGKNEITITRELGAIIHLGRLEIGDVIETVTVPQINGKKYMAKGFASTIEKEYAKIVMGDVIEFTGIDGGNGGNVDIIIEAAPEPGVPSSFSVICNNEKPVICNMINGGVWFNMSKVSLKGFLRPGADNKITFKQITGRITHVNYIEVGTADGRAENSQIPKVAQIIGNESFVKDETGKFLAELGLLKGDAAGNLMLEKTLSRQDSIVLISRLMKQEDKAKNTAGNGGFADIKDSFYNPYIAWAKENKITEGVGSQLFGYNQKVSQQQLFTMLLRAMGYTFEYDFAFNKALECGLANGMDINVFQSTDITREKMAQAVYNSLKAHNKDGALFADALGIKVKEKDAYLQDSFDAVLDESKWSSLKKSNTVENGEALITGGGFLSIATKNRFNSYQADFNVRTKDGGNFTLGLRAKYPDVTKDGGNIWIQFNENIIVSGGTKGKSIPVMVNRINAYPSISNAQIRVKDLGDTVQIFSIKGDEEIPIIELKFIKAGVVVYRNGYPIAQLDGEFECAGHIIFANEAGSVYLDNIKITEPDSVYNPDLKFYNFEVGQNVSFNENFDNGIFNYRAFHERSSKVKLKDNQLNIGTGLYWENVFSTQIRIEKPVIEVDVQVLKGTTDIQIDVANRSVGDHWYSGLNFQMTAGTKYNIIEDNVEYDNMTNQVSFDAPVDFSKKQRVKVQDDGINTVFLVKVDGAWKQLAKVVRTDKNRIVYGPNGEKAATFDRLMRQYGYIRFYSYMGSEALLDNLSISGLGHLPVEIEPLNAAPVPDADKMLNVDDLDTVFGIGYFIYFKRPQIVNGAKTITNSEVEIPKISAALKETNETTREEKLKNVKWGYMWWAEPKVGYYGSRDRDVMYQHMKDLAQAGIDFIYIDQTNLYGGQTPNSLMGTMEALFDTIVNMQERGEKAPHVAIWSGAETRGDGVDDTGREMWQYFYSNPKYKNIWVYYQGKPLQIYTFALSPTYNTEVTDKMTIRRMWTEGGTGTWVFHSWNTNATTRTGLDMEGKPEEINIQPYYSTNFNGNLWNDIDKFINSDAGGRDQGRAYQAFWKAAFDIRPKFVMIWAYNHWDVVMDRPSYAVGADGKSTIGDNFSRNYSGGIEPTKATYGSKAPGDIYLTWTKKYIDAYRQNQQMPADLTGYE